MNWRNKRRVGRGKRSLSLMAVSQMSDLAVRVKKPECRSDIALSINPVKGINARLIKPPLSLSLTAGDFLLVGKLPHISFFSAQAAEVTNGDRPFPSFAILPSEEGLVADLVNTVFALHMVSANFPYLGRLTNTKFTRPNTQILKSSQGE